MKIIKLFVQQPKKLFFLDSAGGFLTAFIVGVLLVHWNEHIGMSKDTLFVLSAVGVFCGLYSLACGIFLNRKFATFLTIIAAVNALYCVASVLLVIEHFEALSKLGVLYFSGEIMIILAVITLEIAAIRALR